ncbi:hypothetical protein [Pseudarthrobacter sp. NS4]|uniref:hypothetical protein n=1 Tax=Pseudarthrobacter sp. NS4 TaxID=2973976 RepID=UPI0021627B56|nr:hypothetical protein [Pseudarthrobacter sp. NS4]
MPVTDNVAWDGRLESFKGRDTPYYVTTAAATAAQCTFCGRPLRPGQLLSLSVDITESTASDGTEYLAFSNYVSHRKCKEPELTVRRAAWRPTALTPLAARVILTQEASGPGSPETIVAALAYTLVPVLTCREAGGELTSVLVSVLLFHGFELAMSPGYSRILAQAPEVEESCAMTITGTGLVTITVGEETFYVEQLNSKNPDDAEWLDAASNGSVLIIAGDNLVITDTRIDLETAARFGTLVIGYAPVRF